MVENEAGAGTLSYPFGRELEGLELSPGSYPVLLSVTADVDGSTEETEVVTELLVYDAKTPSAAVVLAARVHGAPLYDPKGQLMIDPASPEAEKPRADVDRVAAVVLEDPGARLVIAVPPVLLAEWKRLSGGYTLASGAVVGADNPVPLTYAATLTRLRAAIDTGRLELVGLGYADPDLALLAQESLADDIGPQYEAGISACYASLEVTPSTGTVPAGDCVPQAALKSTGEAGRGLRGCRRILCGLGQDQGRNGRVPDRRLSHQRTGGGRQGDRGPGPGRRRHGRTTRVHPGAVDTEAEAAGGAELGPGCGPSGCDLDGRGSRVLTRCRTVGSPLAGTRGANPGEGTRDRPH